MEDSGEAELQGSGKLEFIEDEDLDEAKGDVEQLSESLDDIKLTVKNCKREGSDWVYDVQVGRV